MAKPGRDREGSLGSWNRSGWSRDASKGNKAHGSIGCGSLATEARTTDSSVEKRPGVDRRSSLRTNLGLRAEGRALAAGPNAMQVAPSGVHRSKGTDAARRHRATGTTLATPPRWWRKTPSVRTAMRSVFGFGRRRRWRVRRSSLGVSEHAVLRHSAPGWQQQAEAGSCSAEATWRPGSGLERSEVNRLVPPVRDGMDGLFG